MIHCSHLKERIASLFTQLYIAGFHPHPQPSYLKLNFSPSIFSKWVTAIVHCIYTVPILLWHSIVRAVFIFSHHLQLFSVALIWLLSLRSARRRVFEKSWLIESDLFLLSIGCNRCKLPFSPCPVPVLFWSSCCSFPPLLCLLSRVFQRLHASMVLICPQAIPKSVLLHSMYVYNGVDFEYFISPARAADYICLPKMYRIIVIVVGSVQMHRQMLEIECTARSLKLMSELVVFLDWWVWAAQLW